MLFNIDEDPHEQHDVAAEHPDICREASQKYLQWHDEMMLSMPHPHNVDPMWTVIKEGGPSHARGELPAYCDRLKRTGRGDAAAKLKQRHPLEFEQPRGW
jgi:hypothetical protein